MTEREKNLSIATLEAVELWFSIRFGTYTKDDTVKITEVFDILKDITERLREDTNA